MLPRRYMLYKSNVGMVQVFKNDYKMIIYLFILTFIHINKSALT